METGFEDGYYFYVLSTNEDGTTNLIMDRNINSDGTATKKAIKEVDKEANGGIYNLVAWVSKVDYNDDTNYGTNGNNNKGPITAMNFLHNATKDWDTVPNIVINYEDEGNTESYGYGTIITTNNITKITKKDESAVTVLTDKEGYTNLKARMPMYNEVRGEGKCTTSSGSCPLYLANYLSNSIFVTGEGLQNISGIFGYWTISSYADNSFFAGNVVSNGLVYGNKVGDDSRGVRPVITLEI